MERRLHHQQHVFAFPPTTRSAFLLLANLVIVLSQSNVHDKDVSYTRYSKYPTYCSIPEDMAKRGVPPLQSNLNTKLVHVTSVIRHGARTPWSDKMMCWEGYWEDPETGIWNCDLTTMISPPSAPFVAEVEDDPSKVDNEIDAEEGSSSMFLFEKRYDALDHPPYLTNLLQGTCEKGQLLLRGYEQEITNGKHLRQAYVHDGLSTSTDSLASTDERMRLIDLTEEVSDGGGSGDALGARKPYEEPNLRYRADDKQRTLMSGQVLLRGMWGDIIAKDSAITGENPVIIVHTADFDADIMAPREANCPRLTDLHQEAWQSETYQSFNSSEEANTLRKLMVEELGRDFTDNIHDCLMTTMCTDRKLPDILADYGVPNSGGKYGGNIFQRMIDFNTRYFYYHYLHNDGAFAKLAMGPLWYEIMSNIKPFISGDNSEANLTKMALFSGHDSTIQPLLASLGSTVWDGVWVPYASMMNIEIHEDTNVDANPKYFFRLLLNGDIITSRIEGCSDDSDLCDVSILVNLVEPFAIIDRDCVSTLDEPESQNVIVLNNSTVLAVSLISILLSSLLGALVTYSFLTGGLFFCRKRCQSICRRDSAGISLSVRRGSFTSVDASDSNGNTCGENDEKPPSPTSVYGTTDLDSKTDAELL